MTERTCIYELLGGSNDRNFKPHYWLFYQNFRATRLYRLIYIVMELSSSPTVNISKNNNIKKWDKTSKLGCIGHRSSLASSSWERAHGFPVASESLQVLELERSSSGCLYHVLQWNVKFSFCSVSCVIARKCIKKTCIFLHLDKKNNPEQLFLFETVRMNLFSNSNCYYKPTVLDVIVEDLNE